MYLTWSEVKKYLFHDMTLSAAVADPGGCFLCFNTPTFGLISVLRPFDTF